MRIKGKFVADLSGLKISHDERSGARVATAQLVTSVDEPGSRQLFGEDLTRLAFGPLEEVGGAWRFGYTSLKPSLVCEIHLVRLLGHELAGVHPKIALVSPVSGDVKVDIDLRLPILLESKKLAGALAMAVGEVIEIALTPARAELPGVDGGRLSQEVHEAAAP